MPAQLLGDISLNGYPGAASGSVRFYQPTTLIPVVVYSNDAATSAITQPVALDANGRSAVPIFVTKMVRMIISDVNGATLQDIERADGLRAENTSLVNTSWPLAASEDAAWTLLATSLGTTNGSFKANAPGASGRMVQAKLSEQVSVKDFGAVGNGIADDTAAFSSAVAYAVILGGAIVYVPAGTYLISSPVIISGNGISLKGTGALASVIKNSSATTDCLTVSGSRLFIEDIGLTASTASTGSGVVFSSGVSYVTLSRLRITGHKNGAIDTNASTRLIVRDCEIITTGIANSRGINLAGGIAASGQGPVACLVSGCSVTCGAGGGYAIRFEFSNGVGSLCSASNNYIFTSSGGLYVDSPTFSMMGNTIASDVSIPYTVAANCTDLSDIGNVAGINGYLDSSANQSNTYANPRSGKWSSGYCGTRSAISTTSAYTVTNSQFNFHHVVGTAAGITITISNPSVTPQTKGATVMFFFENTSGGAVTWTLGAGYRGAAVAPATGTGIGVTYTWSTDIVRWIETSRGTAA